jgi:hypothetical protein
MIRGSGHVEQSTGGGIMRTYNLFRSKGSDALFCAVPEERSVPSFLTAHRWEFSGRIDGVRKNPVGFDGKAAAASMRFNGFYLFADFE